MLYVKNTPVWERVIRVVIGMMGLAFAALNWNGSGVVIGLGLMGAMLAMTGLLGFCPMCAIAGRKLGKG